MCGVLAGGVPAVGPFQDMQSALTTLLGPGELLRVGGTRRPRGPAAHHARRGAGDPAGPGPHRARRRARRPARLGAGGHAPAERARGPGGRGPARMLRDQLVDLMVSAGPSWSSGRAATRRRRPERPGSGTRGGRTTWRGSTPTAGLDLTADLARLDAAPPVTADPASPRLPGPVRHADGRRCTGVRCSRCTRPATGSRCPSTSRPTRAVVRRRRARPGVRRRAGPLPVQHGRDGGRGRGAGRSRPHRTVGAADPAALAARARALGPELNVHVDEDGTMPVEPGFDAFTPGRSRGASG